MSWSGGKDSCLALHELRCSAEVQVATLLTTVTRDHDSISIHGVPRSLLHLQAKALGAPLREAFIPAECSNADYEAAMSSELARLREQGIDTVAFGDLFLADIRAYRDALTARNAMKAVYPLWGRDTALLMNEFIASGFRAIACCIDLRVLPQQLAGRLIDEQFIADLPPGVDPCGENGEFHTFVFDGPAFARSVPINIGATVVRGRFAYCELGVVDAPGKPLVEASL